MDLTDILAQLGSRSPALRAVIFCDEEGERVLAHVVDPAVDGYTLDVLGASLAPILPSLAQQGHDAWARVHDDIGVTFMRVVTDRYYLVALCRPRAAAARLVPVLDDVADMLRAHM